MNELNVQATKMQVYLIAFLGILLLPMSLYLFVDSIRAGFNVVPFALALAMIAIVGWTVLMYVRGHRRSIKVFHSEGLALNSGRKFHWADLSRVVHKMAIKPGSQQKRLWRTEIQFNDGSSAWIIPSKVSNYPEVNAFVNGLQCEHVQEDA